MENYASLAVPCLILQAIQPLNNLLFKSVLINKAKASIPISKQLKYLLKLFLRKKTLQKIATFENTLSNIAPSQRHYQRLVLQKICYHDA